MVLALPHLLAEVHADCQFMMTDGFQAIINYVNQHQDIAERLQVFLFNYIHDYWFIQIGAQCISVFGSDIRTNNYLESFHSTLLSQLGRYPNIWNFIEKLLVVKNQYYVEMDHTRRNLSIRRLASRVQRTNITGRLREYIEILREDQDVLMFLRRAGLTMDGYNQAQVGPQPMDP